MTMSSLPSRLNVAHEVRPIGGDIFTPAITTERSFRGTDTLNAFSFSSKAPFAPVRRSMVVVSIAVPGASPRAREPEYTIAATKTETASWLVPLIFGVFIVVSPDERFGAPSSIARKLCLAVGISRVVHGELTAH